jgi:phosphoenolpyruvate synthase/pyruvate phosphate dikinase
MEPKIILPLNDPEATLELVGGKGISLTRMVGAGLPVPDGFHVTTVAYKRFVSENRLKTRILEALEGVDVSNPETLEAASRVVTKMFTDAPIPPDVASAVVQAYNELPGVSPAVAVRSSATAEDLPEASFAGQQETYLNINGADALLEATRKCWASLWTARAIVYRKRQGIHSEGIALAVVVQLLIPAEVSGILFTANPITGSRDQIVINASWGLGEAIVGGLVTPDTLTYEVTTGKLIKRDTAEKLIQTVMQKDGTVEIQVPKNLQRVPVLSDQKAANLVKQGIQIEDLYGMPMDIEWALADDQIAILQARPITALPEPEASIPSDWKLPEGAYIAMRNNIVELMADPLTPLYKTLGLRAVNTSMGNLLISFFGKPGPMPEELIISVNEYAYYNGSIKFWNMIKLFLNARGIMKHMFTGAVERWTAIGRPEYIQAVTVWRERHWGELTSVEILGAVRELTEAAIDAYGVLVSGIIPGAWISEAIFTLAYKLVKRRDDPGASTYLMGFQSVPIRAEQALYDLANWARMQTSLSTHLSDTPALELVRHLQEEKTPPDVHPDEWQNWKIRFQAYLGEYGHMIYNLDFGSPVPADDPSPLLETFKLFLIGQGANPYERQDESAKRREAAMQEMLKRLRWLRYKIFHRNLERAQKYAPLREDGLADVGLSYPLVRKMLRELGRRFVAGGMIDGPDDIFWLNHEEVENGVMLVDQGEALDRLSDEISQRKAIWRAARRAIPPMALPQMKIFGVDLMALKSGGLKKKTGDTLKGVAASPGSVTATACVIQGPEDFSKMKVGDVLVAPLTTPAWTPLFVRAAAIVTDVGGPLSHGSIVAREYGIPAVLGTGGATKRIQNGQVITVDGSSGIVTLNPIEKAG